ncbi:PilZ domain-containing protein [Thermodesulfobacteriota bacterium]
MAVSKKFLLKERRRAARIDSRIPAALVLRRGLQGELVAGPSHGVIIDISSYGAGVSVEQIRVDSSHLFYSPQDNPSYVLHLEVELPPEDERGLETISIPVRPVRFDRVPKPFHIGVEFLLDATDEQLRLLVRLVDENNRGKGGWWQKVIDAFRAVTG